MYLKTTFELYNLNVCLSLKLNVLNLNSQKVNLKKNCSNAFDTIFKPHIKYKSNGGNHI